MTEAPHRRTAFIIVGLLALVGSCCVGSALAMYLAYRAQLPPPTSSRELEDPDERVEVYLERRPNPPSTPLDVYFDQEVAETYHGTPTAPEPFYALVHVEPSEALAWGAECDPLPDEDWAHFDQMGAFAIAPSADVFGPLQSVPIVRECRRDYRYYVIYEREGVVLVFDESADYLSPVQEDVTPRMPLPER